MNGYQLFNIKGKDSPLTYQSMLIRYWLEHHPTDGDVWRCLLVHPQTGQQVGFKSFMYLGTFLATMVEANTEEG